MGEKIQVLSVISRFCEDGLPVISPLRDVMGVADGYGAGYSWHGKNDKPVNACMSRKIGICPHLQKVRGGIRNDSPPALLADN